MEELVGVFERLKFHWPETNTAIAEICCRDAEIGIIAVKGVIESPEFFEYDESYRFYGRFADYEGRNGKVETQFHFRSVARVQPYTRQGVIAYLIRTGKAFKITKHRATLIWNHYGAESIDAIKDNHEAVELLIGFEAGTLARLSAILVDDDLMEAARIELLELFDGRYFPHDVVDLIIQKLGIGAAKQIRDNPYILLPFPGCGFRRVDELYMQLGHDPSALIRQAYCAWQATQTDRTGSTWIPLDQVINAIYQQVGEITNHVSEALSYARDLGLLSFCRTNNHGQFVTEGGRLWIADARYDQQEQLIARRIGRMQHDCNTPWPDTAGIDNISEHQREELTKALIGSFGILGGGPGTGKTHTLAALIRAIIKKYGSHSVALAAPTGKAAVRLAEVMAEQDIHGIATKTLHSLLKLGIFDDESIPLIDEEVIEDEEEFPFLFVFIDESSMNDLWLMAKVFERLPIGCNILLIGDIFQLLPVGRGAPLRDFIAAGIPYGELKEVRRNSGRIVEVCRQIRLGLPLDFSKRIDLKENENFAFLETSTPQQTIDKMFEVLKAAEHFGLDPIWDVQVVIAVNEKSPLSRVTMNGLLQRLNKNEPVDNNCIFRIGDKVVATTNHQTRAIECDGFARLNDLNDVKVANGEQGEIMATGDNTFTVKMKSPYRLIKYGFKIFNSETSDDNNETFSRDTVGKFQLSYAMTVHKSQGSEWKMVIVIVDESPGARNVTSRESFYTGASRGKQVNFAIGKKIILNRMLKRVSISSRKTFLRERILETK